MPVYKLDKLMEETRRIASEYRKSTGSTLPVSAELARFDAARLLGLLPVLTTERAVDALLPTLEGNKKVQIKARVIFDEATRGQRIGQLDLDADWDLVLLVLMNAEYECTHIYELGRDQLEFATPDPQELKANARGALSVKKFKAIGHLLWSRSGTDC